MTEKSFIEILKPFTQNWFQFIIAMTGNEDFAKDCLQDTMVYLWNIRGKLSEIENLNNYGFIVIRNKCYKHLKQQKHLPLDFILDVAIYHPTEVESNEFIRKKVLALAADLPKRQREIFILKDIEGLDYEELAHITGLKGTNIRANLSMARKRLRQQLSKYLEE